MRCLHLTPSGRQCIAEALEDGEFCVDHTTILEPDAGESKNRVSFVYQLTAFILLLIFLADVWQTIRQWIGR